MNTVLITGANKGIGRELVNQYHKDGWNVIACARRPEEIQHHHERLHAVELDVTRWDQIEKLAEQIKNIPIDILINNAGVIGPKGLKLGAVQPEPWIEVLEVNTIAPLMIVQALLPNIAKSKLKIIANVSSTMGSIQENTSGGRYIYRSSKAALNMVTKTLSVDLKDQEVTVVSLHPGWVKTDMGGSDALISPEESVTGLRKVLDSLTLAESGSFIRFDGKKASW